MVFNRRNFVQSAVCLAVAPAFPSLFSRPSAAQSAILIPGQDSSSALFKIHGWDCSYRNVNHSQTTSGGPTAIAFDDGRATIRVMQSWRTAWR
jgi:hypothetical protein